MSEGYFFHNKQDKLYWATLDFEKFYPNLKRSQIRDILIYHLKLTSNNQQLVTLIHELFNYTIDYSGWEVFFNDLGISENKTYEGLPTGLLVAGFLANIALLQVDKKVDVELAKNREVAHFRFVDDHVILATSFDKLIDWIAFYEKTLNEANLGIQIKSDKTEPKELSNYLKDKTADVAEAIKKCTLDPMYPSPLMTETLSKVSGIAKMDLNLMSNNELSQLISDLTHLMIADFPDNEAKKETRISFAATMLSRASTKLQFDYTQIYYIRKTLYEILKKTEQKKEPNQHILFLKSVINNDFQDSTQLLLIDNQVGNDNSTKNVINRLIEKYKEELDIIENQKKLINRKAYNLLYKAFKENHQKVRLLVRLIQFCFRQNYFKFDDIWELIGDLEKGGHAHKLSVSFLYSMYLSLMIESVWYSIKELNDKDVTNEKKYYANKYIDYILSVEFVDRVFAKCDYIEEDYYVSIYTQLKVTLGSILQITKKVRPNCFDKYGILNWNKDNQTWFAEKNQNEINVWLFWILNKTHRKSQIISDLFWRDLITHADKGTISSLKSILLPFPNSEVLNDVEVVNSVLPAILAESKYEGWFYDLIYESKSKKNVLSSKLNNAFYKDILKKIEYTEVGKISLFDFVIECQKINQSFDPRRFEWSSLLFVKKISITIKEFIETPESEDKSLNLHLSNFLIDDDIVNNKVFGESLFVKWSDYKSLINKIKITFKPNELQIKDERFSILSLSESHSQSHIPILNGIGVLLYQILCGTTKFPWVWNVSDSNQILTYLITKSCFEKSLSSYTQSIIGSCMSMKNRETALMKYHGKKIFDDEYSDVLINHIDQLIVNLDKAITLLEETQLSIQSDLRRQLIPVRFETYTKNNNPFKIQGDE